MLKQVLKKVRRVSSFFKRKNAGRGVNGTADAGSADTSQHEPTRKSGDGTLKRSSSAHSSTYKANLPAGDGHGPQEGREGGAGVVRPGSFEPARRSEDRASSDVRYSESPSIPPVMPQLPTIVVGEDLEPIGLSSRKDSEHLPRDDYIIEQSGIPA